MRWMWWVILLLATGKKGKVDDGPRSSWTARGGCGLALGVSKGILMERVSCCRQMDMQYAQIFRSGLISLSRHI